MSDVLYRVRTVYETDTSKGTAGVARMGSALGGLSTMLNAAKAGLGMLFTAATIGGAAALATGVAALTYGVVSLNGQVEATAVGIAGMVQAAQVTNESGGIASWGESMAFAEQAMQQIRTDAAALPGEADDFVEVFRAGIAPALDAGMRAADVAQFTNRFAAVGISFRVDAPQIGRDLNLMLQGRAGAHVNMWNRLKSTIGKTAAEFNAMSAAQRQALIDTALRRYQPMIDAYANTWEAISSTTISYGKDLLRIGTAPLFRLAKSELKSMNDWWGRNLTTVNEVANGIGVRLVASYRRAGVESRNLFRSMDDWSAGPTGQRLLGFADRLRAGASSLANRAATAVTDNPIGAASFAAGGIGLAAGLPGLGLLAGGLMNFATHTAAADTTMANLGNAGANLTTAFFGLQPIVQGVDGVLGSLLAGVLPGWSQGMSNLSASVADAVLKVGPSIFGMLMALAPVFEGFGTIIGTVGMILNTALGEAFSTASTVVRSFADTMKNVTMGLRTWLAQHGITVASTTHAVGEGLRANYSFLTAPFRFLATAATNAGRATGIITRGANGTARHHDAVSEDFQDPRTGRWRSRQVSAAYDDPGFYDNSSLWDIMTRGYRRTGGHALDRRNTILEPETPGNTPAPHVETLAERLAGIQRQFRDSMNGLRVPLEAAAAGGNLGQSAAGARAAAHPGRPVVNVHIHQTINTTDDPDRLLLLTRRAVTQGIFGQVESPSVRVLR